MFRSCLKRVQDARFLRHFHRAQTVLWIALMPVIVFTPLGESKRFNSFAVDYGIVLGTWGFWQSARSEDPTKQPISDDCGT